MIARYSRISSRARSLGAVGSKTGRNSANSAPLRSASTLPTTARWRPWTTTISSPPGRLPVSSSLATVPTAA